MSVEIVFPVTNNDKASTIRINQICVADRIGIIRCRYLEYFQAHIIIRPPYIAVTISLQSKNFIRRGSTIFRRNSNYKRRMLGVEIIGRYPYNQKQKSNGD